MASTTKIEERFVGALRHALADCPIVTDRFYDSFEFTTTGKNLAHPRTLGLIVKACWGLPEVTAVDIDQATLAEYPIRFLNLNGKKLEATDLH